MLSPYRSIGLFSTHVPHQIRYQATQKVPIVVCPIGNVFISYYVDRLRSVHVSDPTPNAQPITQIATDKNFVYTACGTSIYKYRLVLQKYHVLFGYFPMELKVSA